MAKKHLFRSIMLIFIITVLSLTSCGYKEPVETTLRVFTVCEHEPGDWQVDREPTYEDAGVSHIKCIRCGFVLEYKSIPMLSLSQEDLYEKIRPSLVKVFVDSKKWVDGYEVQGSGFFVDDKGTFITNAHVVDGAYSVHIIDWMGVEYEADLLIAYELHDGAYYSDYAVLRVSEYTNSTPVEFYGDASPGDTAYSVGFPNNAEEPYMAQGVIRNVNYRNGILSNCYVDVGSSGGILMNAQGKVLGITSLLNGFSLRYLMFREALEKEPDNAVSPHEYFHPD